MKIGYARVSTADNNLDMQIKQLEDAGCNKIFLETRSGMSYSRPELTKMLNILRAGDKVIVTRLNRLGRNLVHTLKIIEDFKAKSIHFKSLDLGIDTTTAAGKLVMNVLAALAEYERENLLEQSKAGIEQAKANGRHIGRPKGYNKDKLEKVSDLTNQGLSVKQIAEILGCHINTVKIYRKINKDISILTSSGSIEQ